VPVTQKFIATVLILMLAGCATTASRQEKYETSKAILQGSPKVKQRAMDNCMAKIKTHSLEKRQNMADVANTTVDKLPGVFCSRVIDGLADGRVSYNDYNAVLNGSVTPNMIKVVQGR
jgi:hypothetical protein